MAYKTKKKKHYFVINKEGEYAPKEYAGKYTVSKVLPPTMRRGSQVVWSESFKDQKHAELFKKSLEKK